MILRPPLGGTADSASRDGFDPSRIHVPVSHATVDCGVYVDGGRLPGSYTRAAAQAKVTELTRHSGEAFVWIGLHEPDEIKCNPLQTLSGCIHYWSAAR